MSIASLKYWIESSTLNILKNQESIICLVLVRLVCAIWAGRPEPLRAQPTEKLKK